MNDDDLTRRLAESRATTEHFDVGTLSMVEQHLAHIRSYPRDAGPRPSEVSQLANAIPSLIEERFAVCGPTDTDVKYVATLIREPRDWSNLPPDFRTAAEGLEATALGLRVTAALVELRNELDARGWL